MTSNWPLMENNITREDLDILVEFLKGEPILTQSSNVLAFEKEWSEWLGVKYSVFVNSGSSANLITISALKEVYGVGEVIVSPLGWVSDIASILQCGMTPVFADINPRTLCLDDEQVIQKLSNRTKAVFLIHVQGFSGLSERLLKELEERGIPLIEDVCESHGASFNRLKLGSFGLMSNFSFYYAHHMTTIEGGMVCTNDEKLYQILQMFRSHGMVREAKSETVIQAYIQDNPELNPDFIFAFPAYNVRNTEIGAVLGRNQLKRLDENNVKRSRNFQLFLDNLDSSKYYTDFNLEGSSNYAFNLVIKEANSMFCQRVIDLLQKNQIEYRRGSAGGGNQLRQPYLKHLVREDEYTHYPEVEHIHFYGFYVGNYPNLLEEKILKLCNILNAVN